MKNLKVIENRPGYYWFFVPDDKFMHYWDDDVAYFEWAGDETDGWIFFRHI